MKVLLYGRLADALGHEMDVDVGEGCSIGALRQRLAREHAGIAEALSNKRSRALIGTVLALDDGRIVREGDVVEFLPPVSGG